MDDGTAALWRNVRPMPKDKLVWRPALEARKVRELLEELMITTDFTAEQLLTKKMPEMKWGGTERGAQYRSIGRQLRRGN